MSGFEAGCRIRAWMWGAIVGLVTGLLVHSSLGPAAALFLGLIAFLLAGAVFVWGFCDGLDRRFALPPAALERARAAAERKTADGEGIAPPAAATGKDR